MPVWGWLHIGCGGCGGFLILLLPAILIPVFSQARASARRVSCSSNLKQVGLATTMYLQDYDDRFPRSAEWMDELSSYAATERLFHCPTVFSEDSTKFGYAYNRDIAQKQSKDFNFPAQTILQFESIDLSRNASLSADNSAVFALRHNGPSTNPGRGHNQVMMNGSSIFVVDKKVGGFP
jgi:hypothetical protein